MRSRKNNREKLSYGRHYIAESDKNFALIERKKFDLDKSQSFYELAEIGMRHTCGQ